MASGSCCLEKATEEVQDDPVIRLKDASMSQGLNSLYTAYSIPCYAYGAPCKEFGPWLICPSLAKNGSDWPVV